MSGGSYNYACFVADMEDIITKRSDIESLCERLEGIPYATKPAEDLRNLLNKIDTANEGVSNTLRGLSGVMHALEWWDSRDYSEAQFREEVKKYTNEFTNRESK